MKLTPLLLAVPALLVINAYADQQEQLIVTGVHSPLTIDNLSSSINVITREKINELNKTQLADILQTVPGLLIEKQGGPGGIAAASIRGGEPNFTVVMVDGVVVNDPTNSRGGSFDLNNINVNAIERIEIVKGPQSAVYGADALAGVINIITRRAEEGHNASLHASAGAEGYNDVGFQALGVANNIDYAVQLNYQDNGEPIEGSTAENTESNLKLGWRNATHDVVFAYRYFDGERTSYPEQSGGPMLATSDDLDEAEYTDTTASLHWNYKIMDFWTSQLNASRYTRDEIFTSPGIPPYTSVPPNGADNEYERTQLTWINTFGQKGRLWSNVGLEQREEDGESVGYLNLGVEVPTNFALTREIVSGFVDLNSQITEAWLLQAGVRHDDAEGFDAQTTWNVGTRFALNGHLTLRATAGEGFKLPSFIGLGHPLVGNPDLLPERAESWDVGIDWQVNDNLSTTLNYFDNQFIDPIDFDGELFMNVNRDRIDTRGIEWQGSWTSTDNIYGIQAHASYTDIEVINSDKVLNGRPEWRAGAVFNWAFVADWLATLDYEWTGEQYSGSLHSGIPVTEELDAYHRVDLNISWDVSENINLNLAIENLLDEDYQTTVGFPAAGQLWRFGVNWKL